MSYIPHLETAAQKSAEEVLRRIYGDDFSGCAVRLETVAGVILHALRAETVDQPELLELFEKTLGAIELLSTPPKDQPATPVELQKLLSERLDRIRVLSTKALGVTAILSAAPPSPDQPETI